MDDILLSQAEFARRWNAKYPNDTITRQYVNKLVKDNTFSLINKKIPFAASIKILEDKKIDPERESQREAIKRAKQENTPSIFSEEMIPEDSLATASKEQKEEFWDSKKIDEPASESVEDSEDDEFIDSDEVFTDKNQKELKKLLEGATTSNQKVTIENTFWNSKINKLKALEAEKKLIPVDDAKKAIEVLIGPLNFYLDDQSNNIKNHFPDLSDEVIEWIAEENNRQKEQLRSFNWTN